MKTYASMNADQEFDTDTIGCFSRPEKVTEYPLRSLNAVPVAPDDADVIMPRS